MVRGRLVQKADALPYPAGPPPASARFRVRRPALTPGWPPIPAVRWFPFFSRGRRRSSRARPVHSLLRILALSVWELRQRVAAGACLPVIFRLHLRWIAPQRRPSQRARAPGLINSSRLSAPNLRCDHFRCPPAGGLPNYRIQFYEELLTSPFLQMHSASAIKLPTCVPQRVAPRASSAKPAVVRFCHCQGLFMGPRAMLRLLGFWSDHAHAIRAPAPIPSPAHC